MIDFALRSDSPGESLFYFSPTLPPPFFSPLPPHPSPPSFILPPRAPRREHPPFRSLATLLTVCAPAGASHSLRSLGRSGVLCYRTFVPNVRYSKNFCSVARARNAHHAITRTRSGGVRTPSKMPVLDTKRGIGASLGGKSSNPCNTSICDAPMPLFVHMREWTYVLTRMYSGSLIVLTVMLGVAASSGNEL